MGFKYVMFNNGTVDIPMIFPDSLSHVAIAHAIKTFGEFKHFKIASAGFVQIGLTATTYGKSETLNIDSRPEDGIIIGNYPYTHGIRSPEIEIMVKEAEIKLKGE